ncbi:MAG: hypothetical protein JRH07_06515 [Deltaproteobacteria bacterium]|nr:hypothetical protein [Deltaproteobacteria bacterium]MBW2121487.1 hypothetical protein [Deltaproteobacteria bacterium]
MKRDFFRTLAQDLLTLEVNTIIKEDMSGIKMPPSRRQALYELARGYHLKLKELGVRDPVYWRFAGIRSFGELRDRAKYGIGEYEKRERRAPEEKKRELREDIKILERIRDQSSDMVGLFYELRENVRGLIERGEKGYRDVPEQKGREVLEQEEREGRLERAPAHTASQMWNNDIERKQMNGLADLDLTAEQVTRIRKAWEIGTERIVLQTVIQIDGDVTTRLSEGFAEAPDATVLRMHNDSIETSTRFWSNLVKTLAGIAGKGFEAILG